MTTAVETRSAPRAVPWITVHLLLALVGTALTGGYVLTQLQQFGHAAFNGDSLGMFWGLPIVTYDFFLLSSTGLVMLASAWTVFGITSFEPVARRATVLSMGALAGGVAALFLELGYPVRALMLIPFSFQTAAPLFWKVWGIIVMSAVLGLMLLTWLLPGRASRPAMPLAIVGLAAALFITFVAGGVYGWMAMRPFWYGGQTSLAFIVEALLGAVTLLIVFTWVAHGFRLGRFGPRTAALCTGPLGLLFAALLVGHAFFVLSRMVAGLWSNADGMEVWQHLWGEALFHAEVWIGLGVPLVLTLLPDTRRSPAALLVAAGVALVALFLARYHFVIGGQMVPLFKGSWAHGLLGYTPSLTEFAVLATSVFLANLVFAALEWLLRPGEAPGGA